MTPRALIAAIGTTAIAFAAIITSLSTSAVGSAQTSEPTASTATARVAAYAAPSGAANADCPYVL